MLIAIRHGSTNMNEGKEKMRGWLPIPLDKKGMEQACNTARYLKDLNIINTKNPLYTSSLPRAVQTAQEIASELGMTIEPTDALKDWNVGNMAGQEVNKTLDLMHSYLDNPTKKVPNGESYKDFYFRVHPFVQKLVESSEVHAIVTHNRVMTLLHALTNTNGKVPNVIDLKKKGPVEPGGILIIEPDWSAVFTDGMKGTYV